MKLLNVESARGLAALAVVMFHANAGMGTLADITDPTGLIALGEHGVDFFFVLSGFIIAYVHRDDIGRRSMFPSYVKKRLMRVYPLIWIVVIPWLALRMITGNGSGDADVIVTSLLLVPSLETPVPNVLWTLRHEILFYLAFGLLIVWRLPALWLIACCLLLSLLQVVLSLAGRPVEGLASLFLSAFNLQFAFGAAIGYFYQRGLSRTSLWPILFGLVAVGIVLGIERAFGLHRLALLDYTSPVATGWTLVLGLAFALLLYGIVKLPATITAPRPLVMLGSASFAIYLSHVPVMTLCQRLVARLPPGPLHLGLGHAVLICASIAAGIGLHLAVERPVTQFLRQRALGGDNRPPLQPSAVAGD